MNFLFSLSKPQLDGSENRSVGRAEAVRLPTRYRLIGITIGGEEVLIQLGATRQEALKDVPNCDFETELTITTYQLEEWIGGNYQGYWERIPLRYQPKRSPRRTRR